MSASLRRWRAAVYLQQVTNDAGYASEAYVSTGVEYWCNVVETSAREKLRTMTTQHEHDATLDVADEAVIPENCLLVISDTGFAAAPVQYLVRGVIPRPLARSQWLVCQRTDVPLASGSLTASGLAPATGIETANGILV